MAKVLVICVNKPNRQSPHEAITHIDGPGGGGWRWASTDVVRSIQGGENTFYTMVGNRRAEIG